MAFTDILQNLPGANVSGTPQFPFINTTNQSIPSLPTLPGAGVSGTSQFPFINTSGTTETTGTTDITQPIIPTTSTIPDIPVGGGTFDIPETSNVGLQGAIDAFSGAPGQFNQALSAFRNLPGTIDEFTQNAINRQRATGDQITSILNKVANQRAGSGILGGTEQTGLRADLLTNFARLIQENQGRIEREGNLLKADAIARLPQTALSGTSALINLFGANAQDKQAWANLAAQMINSGF